MGSTLTAERRNKLAQILVAEGSVKVGELAEMFQVSTETIRKDLIYLENEGIARKSHGGAIVSSDLLERPLSSRNQENVKNKVKIAQAALKLIPDNGVIILDSGSTTFSIAKLLTIKKGNTVITNSIDIAKILSGTENVVYSTGGEIRGSSLALIGLWAIHSLKSVKADIAFLGTDGFESRGGPCTASYAEAEVKKTMIGCSKEIAIVCDSSKFKMSGMFQFAEWKDIDFLVTDAEISENETKPLHNLTKVIISE